MSFSAVLAFIVAGFFGHPSGLGAQAATAVTQNPPFPTISLDNTKYGHTAYTAVSAKSAGTTYIVSTSADLIKKLSTIKDGDTLVLKGGKYDLGTLVLTRTTASSNVIIRGTTPDCSLATSAHIIGKSKIKIMSDYWQLENLCFDSVGQSATAGSLDVAVTILADRVTLVRNTFANLGSVSHPVIVVQVGGSATGRRTQNAITISGNVFKNIAGIGLSFPQPAPQYTGGYRWALKPQVTYNSFLATPRVLSNGGEAIILGTAWDLSPLLSDTLGANVSRNVFNEWDGDSEIVSIKSSSNTVSDNVILNSSGHINVRTGDNNVIERNLIDSHAEASCFGLRVSGKGNIFQYNVLDLSPTCLDFVFTPYLLDTNPYPDKSYTIAYYPSVKNYFRWNTVRGGAEHVFVLKNGSTHRWPHTPPQASDLPSNNTIRLNTFYGSGTELQYRIDLDPSILTVPTFVSSNSVGTDNVFYGI